MAEAEWLAGDDSDAGGHPGRGRRPHIPAVRGRLLPEHPGPLPERSVPHPRPGSRAVRRRLASEDELAAAQHPFSYPAWEPDPDDSYAAAKATEAVVALALGPDGRFASLAGRVVPNRAERAYQWASRAAHAAVDAVRAARWEGQRSAVAAQLRDHLGPLPFRAVEVDPNRRTSTVNALARQVSDTRDFSPKPLLWARIRDAGYETEELLGHCRGDVPHTRGCWVVDLIRGLS